MRDKDFIIGNRPATKREVRALIMELLDITNAGVFLDIGASTGTVSIEASLLNPQCNVLSIETNKESIGILLRNINTYNADVTVLEGEAPFADGSHEKKELEMALVGEQIDRVNIGGTRGKLEIILEWLIPFLADDAIIAIEASTIELTSDIIRFVKTHDNFDDIEATQLTTARLTSTDYNYFFKPCDSTSVFSFRYKKS